jgi:putative Mn2+ efflux pump MntP
MNFTEILALSLALAMDAFAVSVASGICLREVNKRQAFRLAFHFGLFQALMPVIGWYLGLSIKSLVTIFAPWIAFGLLTFIGVKMIIESREDDKQECDTAKDPTKGLSLIILSIATSIDALAVGLSFSILNRPIFFAATVIGIVAFIMTVIGIYLGKKVAGAPKLGKIAELTGGTVLVLIGLKVLLIG